GHQIFTFGSPDITEHLTTDTLLACLPVGHEALARRQHGDPEPTEDAWQAVGTAVDPKARLGDALQASYDPDAVGGVLERDLEHITGMALPRECGEARDIALALEDLCQGFFHPRAGHADRLVHR